MILKTAIARIKGYETLLHEVFATSPHGWEIVNKPSEEAYMKGNYYYMENKSENYWMYYHKKTKLKATDDFILKAKLGVALAKGQGSFGLLWGFNEKSPALNRFILSSTGRYYGMVHFERKHSLSFQRNYGRLPRQRKKALHEMTLVKLGKQLFFFADEHTEPLFQCNAEAYPWLGNHIGFYVEPGIQLKVESLQLTRLITEPVEQHSWKQLLKRAA